MDGLDSKRFSILLKSHARVLGMHAAHADVNKKAYLAVCSEPAGTAGHGASCYAGERVWRVEQGAPGAQAPAVLHI